MFTPLKPEIIEKMKEKGNIQFFVFGSWELMVVYNEFTAVPHKIVYVEAGNWHGPHNRIFDCKLTLEKHSLVLEEITLANKIPLPKSSEYLFLEMTLEAAEDMAIISRKGKLRLTSNLSTFSEVASEQDFIIRRNKFRNIYTAIKILNYNKKGTCTQ